MKHDISYIEEEKNRERALFNQLYHEDFDFFFLSTMPQASMISTVTKILDLREPLLILGSF